MRRKKKKKKREKKRQLLQKEICESDMTVDMREVHQCNTINHRRLKKKNK